ncbi:MAG: hemerythrin domain-containing protein [Thiogranum sp.]|nr:hemerythrin domain-containing protein [Thiogranum sp.]
MPYDLGTFRAEHTQFRRLIDLLDDKRSSLYGEQPDYEFFKDVVGELMPGSGPFHSHHRRETRLFDALDRSACGRSRIVATHHRQHLLVGRYWVEMASALCRAINSDVFPWRQRLDCAIGTYCEGVRAQIMFEEQVMYPDCRWSPDPGHYAARCSESGNGSVA